MSENNKNIAIVTGKKLHSFVISELQNGELTEIAEITDGSHDEKIKIKAIDKKNATPLRDRPRIEIKSGVVETLTVGDYILFEEHYEKCDIFVGYGAISCKPRNIRCIEFTKNLSHEERIENFKKIYKEKLAMIQQSKMRKR